MAPTQMVDAKDADAPKLQGHYVSQEDATESFGRAQRVSTERL